MREHGVTVFGQIPEWPKSESLNSGAQLCEFQPAASNGDMPSQQYPDREQRGELTIERTVYGAVEILPYYTAMLVSRFISDVAVGIQGMMKCRCSNMCREVFQADKFGNVEQRKEDIMNLRGRKPLASLGITRTWRLPREAL